MLANIPKWCTLEDECASDPNTIKFNITPHKAEETLLEDPGQCLRIEEYQYAVFYEKFKHITAETNQIEKRSRSYDSLDENVNQKFKTSRDMQDFTMKLEEAIQKAGMEICGQNRSKNTAKGKEKGKTVPMWTNGLIIMRRKTNTLRRRYQRTTSNEAQRQSRKTQYNKAKAEYQAAVIKEKTRSCKEYCTTTSPLNPSKEVYKLSSNKTRRPTTITTLPNPDGTTT